MAGSGQTVTDNYGNAWSPGDPGYEDVYALANAGSPNYKFSSTVTFGGEQNLTPPPGSGQYAGVYGRYKVIYNSDGTITYLYVGDPRAPSTPSAPKPVEAAGWVDQYNAAGQPIPDGIDDRTGLAEGVVKEGNEYYVLINGKKVWTTPTGAAITETPKENVKWVTSDGSDGLEPGTMYYWENGKPVFLPSSVTPKKQTATSGGGGGGGVWFNQFGSGGKAMGGLDSGGGKPPMSPQDEVALINAKVNAAKAYAESLMTYDPAGYAAFLGGMGGGSLANAISSGGHAITANALKPSQDILNEIAKLDRLGGKKTDLSGATSGVTTGGIRMYAYGTGMGGLSTGAGSSNQLGKGGRPADYVPPTAAQQLEQRILKAAKRMLWLGPITAISDIPAEALRRIQQQIATEDANREAMVTSIQNRPSLVRWNSDYTFGTYVDMNGRTHQGTPEQLKVFIDADRQKQRALSLMTPSERLIYDSMQPKQQGYYFNGNYTTTPSGGLGFGGGESDTSVANYLADMGYAEGVGAGLINKPKPAPAPMSASLIEANNEAERQFKQWLKTQQSGIPANYTIDSPVYSSWLEKSDPVGFKIWQQYQSTKPKSVPAAAYGGLVNSRVSIVGDPQRDGKPNPEIIYNPTSAPFAVIPMKDTMPKYAMGTLSTDTSKPEEPGTGYKPGEGGNRWGNQGGNDNTEDPIDARTRAMYPWMNDPNYFMNVEFWKQDPILRDLYLKGLQMQKGIPMASVMAAAEQNKLGGVTSNQMQTGW